ncbi:MAG: DUF2256 domain-containing protein [Verrucomicrobiaceae bacterium]|nr:DUF2256 domain-containing protein [Verrucomicrobiaceae bacterium]
MSEPGNPKAQMHRLLPAMHGVKKQHLPTKICPACQRPFAWRKKWERDWENVKFCSERCKRSAKP